MASPLAQLVTSGLFKVCPDGCDHGEAHQACVAAGAELASLHSADDVTDAADTCAGDGESKGAWKSEFYNWPTTLHQLPAEDELKTMTPAKVMTTDDVRFSHHYFGSLGFHDRFVVRVTGMISIEESGVYTFMTCSDDGSNLFVGPTKVLRVATGNDA